MSKAIGIDLGTGNSCVAVVEHGVPTVIPNAEGERTTPSVVTVKDGDRKVGSPAKRQQVVNPENTIYNIKRFMGSSYADASGIAEKMTYKVINENGNPRIVMNGRNYSPEEISSYILGKMKQTAEDYLGETVTDAVITCPAWFDSSAREATKIAGTACGLNVRRVINEPTAAVLAANFDVSDGDKVVLVADIGQGTTDFSVCEVSGDKKEIVVEVKASDGDVFLGGADFDLAIVNWILDEIKAQKNVDLSSDKQALQRITEAAETAKKELSVAVSTEINLPYIGFVNNAPVNFSETLTRAKFDVLTKPLVDRIVSKAKNALANSKKTASDLDCILLVGGQSRSISIQDALYNEFHAELNKSVNPDEAVAIGAAIQANKLVGGESSTDILLLDVTPLNLGIETAGGVFTTLIKANTTIPTKASDVFSTYQDNQTAVTINVLQGVRPMASDNKSIGHFNLEGIMPAKRGVPKIEVTFDVDANGILSVSAKDIATGKEQKVTIQSKTSISDDEINRMKAEAEQYAESDAKATENIENSNKCESTIYSIDNMLENAADKISEEDKTYLNEKRNEFKTMRENKNFDGYSELEKEVQERLFAISAKLYGNGSTEAPNMSESAQNVGGFNPNDINDIFNGKMSNN